MFSKQLVGNAFLTQAATYKVGYKIATEKSPQLLYELKKAAALLEFRHY